MNLQEKPQSGMESLPGTPENDADAVLLFYLFRLLPRHAGASSSIEDESQRDRIEEIIRARPVAEIAEGCVWRIDNVQEVAGTNLLFSVGPGEPCKFRNAEDARSPCTYALYDSEYGLLSMALKTTLSPDAEEMANGLRKLLNTHAGTCGDEITRIEINGIIDPDGFIDRIMDADVVTEFGVRSREQSVSDAWMGCDLPMRQLLEATGARSVQTTLTGDDLDREVLEKLTRSAAIAGHEVSARLCGTMGQRPVMCHMQGDPVDFLVKGPDIPTQAESILVMGRQIYSHIRGNLPG